jgi:ABC-2 type transport system permease protein
MFANVFVRTLADRGRAMLLYSIGLTAVAALYLSVFPAMQDTMATYAAEAPEALMGFLGEADLAQPAGYLGATMFGVFGPLVVVAAAAVWGAGAIAGEEERGTLALLLTVPVARVRVATEKLGAVVVATAVIVAATFVAVAVFTPVFGLDVALPRILAVTLHLLALGLFVVGVAFGLGAATGSRTLALGGSLGIVALSFVTNGVAGFTDGLGWLRWISPYAWYAAEVPIEQGVSWGHVALLVGLGAAAALAGILRVDRRDLR